MDSIGAFRDRRSVKALIACTLTITFMGCAVQIGQCASGAFLTDWHAVQYSLNDRNILADSRKTIIASGNSQNDSEDKSKSNERASELKKISRRYELAQKALTNKDYNAARFDSNMALQIIQKSASASDKEFVEYKNKCELLISKADEKIRQQDGERQRRNELEMAKMQDLQQVIMHLQNARRYRMNLALSNAIIECKDAIKVINSSKARGSQELIEMKSEAQELLEIIEFEYANKNTIYKYRSR
jgi:hypothetical protein